MNITILSGRLTKDPELSYLASGAAKTTFTLAVDRNNEKKETDFINIVCWMKLAENVGNYCRKGRLVIVEGRIQTRSYDNNEGKKVFVTEVVANKVEFTPNGKNGQSAGMMDGAKPVTQAEFDDDNPFV